MEVWHSIKCHSEISKLSSMIEKVEFFDCLMNEFPKLLRSSALFSFERQVQREEMILKRRSAGHFLVISGLVSSGRPTAIQA